MAEATPDAGARKGDPRYPRSFQVSVTTDLADIIDEIADKIQEQRGLPRRSTSLVIREALEEKYASQIILRAHRRA